VGEIILVVIGILIALQINNWSVEKEDRKTERTLLKSIKKDLERDIQEFRNVRHFEESQKEATSRLLDYLIDTSKPLEDSIQFINDFHKTIYFMIPSANRTAYDIATSTGYLNKITSESLVNELSNYFNNIALEQHIIDTKRFINVHNENYLLKKYRMFSQYVEALDGQGGTYALERYNQDNRPILQPRDIRGDVSLENYLNNLSIRLTIGIIGLKKEQQWAHDLIQKIENHINPKQVNQ